MAPRSASEYTATVSTPSSRHARITRTAISPRLATRIFLKSFAFTADSVRRWHRSCRLSGPGGRGALPDGDQRLVRGDHVALLDVDLQDVARLGGHDVVLHLHGLEHRHHVAELDLVADLYRDLHDQALHGRGDGAVTGAGGRRS